MLARPQTFLSIPKIITPINLVSHTSSCTRSFHTATPLYKAAKKPKKKKSKGSGWPYQMKKYNVWGAPITETRRPRPPVKLVLPKVPRHFYKLWYFLSQLRQAKLTHDWEQGMQLVRQIQKYVGTPGMPKRLNDQVLNWFVIFMIRAERPVEAIEIWRGMRNRDVGLMASAIRMLRAKKIAEKNERKTSI